MKKLTIMLSAAAVVAGTFAEEFSSTLEEVKRYPTPIAIGLASVLKLPCYDRDVMGIRASILHSCELNVYGIDAGLVGCNKGAMAGVQANAFNWVDGGAYGIQVGGVGNYVTGNFYGLQVGGLLSHDLGETYGAQFSALNFSTAVFGLQAGVLNWNYVDIDGVQVGVVNVERHDMTGASVGFLNFCHGAVTGGQIGAFNFANGNSCGFQVGLVNAAQNFVGVQVGLVNINMRGCLPIMVVANANF